MKIAFVGDIHGRVYHALAAVLTLQARLGQKLDLVIQVGDLGAFPDPGRFDEPTRRFAELDPTELDFSRLLRAEGVAADAVRRSRALLPGPIHFIRGNHEDMAWLSKLRSEHDADAVAVDPFDLLHYIRDGAVLSFDGFRVGFLGGIEAGPEDAVFDSEAFDELRAAGTGSIDLLVTHDPPYGVAKGYFGQTQGSQQVTDLVGLLQPTFHVAGHLHHMIGPKRYGRTTYIGLSILLRSLSRGGSLSLQNGSLALLDTATEELRFITDGWLEEIGAGFVFHEYLVALTATGSQHRAAD